MESLSWGLEILTAIISMGLAGSASIIGAVWALINRQSKELGTRIGRVETGLRELRTEIQQQRTKLCGRIDQQGAALTERADHHDTAVTERIDRLGERIDRLWAFLTERTFQTSVGR